MNFAALDPGTFGQPAALLTIADAALKATLVLAGAALGAAALRRSSAAARHLVWTLGLLGALAAPGLSIALPRWEVPIVRIPAGGAAVAPSDHAALREPAPAAAAPAAGPVRLEADAMTGEDRSASAAATATGNAGPGGWMTAVSWPAALLGIWIAGVGAIVARLLLGLAAVQWMSRHTERVTDASWLPLARALAASVGVNPRVTFLRSPRATMPMAWGLFRPSVLMPADADAWPEARLRIVLLHELAHVKRRDCLTHALVQLACAVHWFNPLAWVAARRARTERERACDDLVLAAGTRGSEYADQLLDIARVMRAGRFPALLAGATLAMAHRTQLEGRLIAILDPKLPRAGLSRLRAAAATLAAACALVPFATVQPWAYAQGERQPVQPPAQAAPPQPAPAAPVPAQAGAAPAAQPDAGPQPRPFVQIDADRIAQFGEEIGRRSAEGVAGAASEFAASAAEAVVGGLAQGVVEGVRGGLEAQFGQTAAPGGGSKADPKTVAALTAALKDSDRQVREAAMHALIRLRDPAIFEPLVAALRDSSPDVREQAVHGLTQLRDRRAVAPLTAALKDENAGVREGAAHALSQMRDPASVDALLGALKDPAANVREQAAFALGQLRDGRAVDGLSGALKDENADVREQAAFALGQIRDRRAAAALAGAMSDASPDVREQAVFALGQLRDPAAVDGLAAALKDSNPDVREQAAFALGQIRDRRAVTTLVPALKDADADVREQAAFALGQIRDRGAVEPLMAALKDGDEDVREQAAFALGQIRDPRAMDALTDALQDASASVRQQAAFALGQLVR
jgi:HEAT repeat protein/beta-lactamase regulating signal transducer with metallopeptidase domain